MKYQIVQFAHRYIAQTVYDELRAAGIRVDSAGVRKVDRYYAVCYMPIGAVQRDFADQIINRYIWQDTHWGDTI